MSGIRDKDLVRVQSHDELRVGLTVVFRPCRRHGKPCASLLLNKRPDWAHHVSHFTGESAPCPWPWSMTHTHDVANGRCCFCYAIRDGRLYRLRDLDDAGEQDVVASRPKAAPVAVSR